MNNVKTLKYLAILEGISYLLLFVVSMPLKYYCDMPQPNYYIGMAHGVLFIAYCIWVLIVGREKSWSVIKVLLALAASLFPFTTFIVERKWLKD